MENPRSRKQLTIYILKLFLSVLWGCLFVFVGLILCLTIIGIPIGLLLFVVGAMPWVTVEKRRIAQRVAWQFRDRPMDETTPKPWSI